jgi:two-component system LytT family response regulator
LKILIVEDEIIAANRIKEMLLLYDSEINVIGVIDSIVDTINFFIENESEIDLILMDIQLADGICFEIFEEIKINKPIIFITAYDQYTLKAFKVNSVDYLLKPIETDEFFRSLDKFKSIHYKDSNIENLQSLLESLNQNKNTYKFRFLIKKPTGFVPISTNQIAYFYSEDKLTFIKTWDNCKHVIDMTLEELTSKLNPKEYFKISRSFIVHHKSVEEIKFHLNNRMLLKLKPLIDKDVFVSRNNSKPFKFWMNK